MGKFTKEMVDDYADKLLIGLTEEENKMVLDEFNIIDKDIAKVMEIDNIESVEPMTHTLDDFVYELREDVKEEYDGFTHLFNASKGLHHRDISLVNMAFDDTCKYVEIVGDGIHLNKETLKLVHKNIRRDRLMLVSDAIAFAGKEDGDFLFEGKMCHKKGRECKNEDNKICGGASFIIDEIKNMYEVGASLNDLLLMSSLNAYRFYGLDKRFGSLVKGKYADIVVLDDDLNLVFTYGRGKIINA